MLNRQCLQFRYCSTCTIFTFLFQVDLASGMKYEEAYYAQVNYDVYQGQLSTQEQS